MSACYHRPPFRAIASSTTRVLFWNVARLTTQLIWVVLMARTLGVEGYGAYSGVAGLALAFSGLVGAGLGLRMYQDVVRKPKAFGVRWAQATRWLGWSGLVTASAFAAVASKVFDSVSTTVVAAIALSELLVAPVVGHIALAYAAHGKFSSAAAAPVMLSMGRVVAIGVLGLLGQNELQLYAMLHVGATVIAASVLWFVCLRSLKPPAASARLDSNAVSDGAKLSAVWTSGLALGSIDKALVLKFGTEDVAGHYTVASRFAGIVALPMEALLVTVLPKLFRIGIDEPSKPSVLSALFFVALVYGGGAGFLMWCSVDLITVVVGEEFESAVPAMAVLSLFVPANCLRISAAGVLLSHGWIRWRLVCELSSLFIMALLMACWVPAYSAVGAAWAIVVSENLLATSMWLRVLMQPDRPPVTPGNVLTK